VTGQGGRTETMQADGANRRVAWTPWTEGETQMIRVFSATLPPGDAVSLGLVVHFTDSPLAKAQGASACTVPTACTTNNSVLDAAIAQARKSVAGMMFQDDGSSFVCTGTLVNTERFPEPFFLTASHCIESQDSAASVTTFWFFENTTCDGGVVDPAFQQRSGGSQLVFTTHDNDSTLLKLSFTPPAGAVFARMNADEVSANASIVNISHPQGDTGRLALGLISNEYIVDTRVQPFLAARFTRGIVEGGSSGSALFVLANGTLEVRGTLLGTTIEHGSAMSCTNTNEEALFSRLSVFLPEIAPYIKAIATPADDAPNRPIDLFSAPISDPNGVDKPLNERGNTLEINNRRIDYGGDMDVYRFRLSAPAYVSAWSEGSIDTVGALVDSLGRFIVSNDDDQSSSSNYNFGITQQLAAGTYYLQVSHYEPTGTGAYNVRLKAESVGTNYTDLWWNPSESGWGVNVNHQDDTLFATLFTYDAGGKSLWLSMSSGVKQPDGSYFGDLYRTTGPAVDSAVWNPMAIAYSRVGTMRFSFATRDTGTLTYSVNGVQVVKAIRRIEFATPPTCTWDRGDRADVFNFQDLWWGGTAESGWGINLTHQGDKIFATLFTYDAQGQPLWLVMSNGALNLESTLSFSGDLFRTSGPPFNAIPFTPIGQSNYTQVGRMTITFTRGDKGLLNFTYNGSQVSKTIERLTFGTLRTRCEDPFDE
jgi:lysyl endopeptidase